MSAQYRVVVAKKEERVDGPDNADVIVSIDAKDAAMDPTVAYMLGKLKAEGSTGALLEELQTGRARAVIEKLLAAN